MSLRVAIVGPTGYTGLHLLKILLRHPAAKVTYLASKRNPGPDITEIFPQLLARLDPKIAQCQPIEPAAIAQHADVAFTCLPHKVAMATVPGLRDAGLHVIDLSADYRFDTAGAYEQAYEHTHSDKKHIPDAVYGLPEQNRSAIAGAHFVANPGCYPTAAALAISPMLASGLAKKQGIIINAASGTTGGGRKASQSAHFPEHNEAFYAYGQIGQHRHQAEINQTLSHVAGGAVHTLFVPHLLPVDRGILETIYLEPATSDVTEQALYDVYEAAYQHEPFVRVRQNMPNIKAVRDTNFCDVAVRLVKTPSSSKIVVFAAIDNMIKGASGQAVQNMNLMFNLDEQAGLR